MQKAYTNVKNIKTIVQHVQKCKKNIANKWQKQQKCQETICCNNKCKKRTKMSKILKQ